MSCESCAGDRAYGYSGTCAACRQTFVARTPDPAWCMSASEEIEARAQRGMEISDELRYKAAEEAGM